MHYCNVQFWFEGHNQFNYRPSTDSWTFLVQMKNAILRNFVAIGVIIGNNRLYISGRLIYIWCVNWSNKRFLGFECESAVIKFEMQNVIEGDLFTELSPVCLMPPPYPLTHMDRGRLILSIFGYISPDLVLNDHPELLS